MIAIALTSVPPRFPGLDQRLGALLDQGAEAVVLTLPWAYARFPDWDGALPPLPDGVTLLRGADCGPATKFIQAARALPQAELLICDDDCDYAPGWLAAFRAARARHPEAVIAASTFGTERLGLAPGGVIVQGFAGVLLRPSWLGGAAPEGPALWVDDVWLSARIAAAGRAVHPCGKARAKVRPRDAAAPLQTAKISGRTRAELNRDAARALAKALAIWTGVRSSSL